MNQVPISWHLEFSNENQDLYHGFTPFTDVKGNYICKRRLVVVPRVCEADYAIKFEIYDCYRNKEHGDCVRKLVSMTYYGKDNPDEAQMIEDLCSGDLRGKVGERCASTLYNKLFQFTKWMKYFLPEVYEFDSQLAKKYNFEMKIGKVGFGHDPIPEQKN